MKRTDWTVTEESTRPFGKPDRCFYCGQLIGQQHKRECSIRSKTVVVDFTFRTVLSVPEHWDEEQVEHYYNCSLYENDILDKLQARLDKLEELEENGSGICEAEYIGDADQEDEDDYGVCFVDELES